MLQNIQSATETKKYNNIGWIVTTFFKLNDTHRLRVTTSKENGTNLLTTIAEGLESLKINEKTVVDTFIPNKDFKKVLVKHHDIIRVTENVINNAHAAVLETIVETYEEAFAFYN